LNFAADAPRTAASSRPLAPPVVRGADISAGHLRQGDEDEGKDIAECIIIIIIIIIEGVGGGATPTPTTSSLAKAKPTAMTSAKVKAGRSTPTEIL